MKRLSGHRMLGLLAGALLATLNPAAADTLIVLNKAEASASLLNPDTGKELRRLPTGIGPHEVAVAPDGRHAVISNYGQEQPGNTLTLIDLSVGSVVKTISLGQYQRPHGVQWPQPDLILITAEEQQTLLLLTVSTGAITPIKTGQQTAHMVAVSPDGGRAFVANIGAGSISVVDLQKRRIERHIATGKGAEGIAVTPDGKEVWVSNRDADTLSIIDIKKLSVVATLPSAKFPIRVQITPNGRFALVSNAKSAELAVFDTATRQELRRIRFTEAGKRDGTERMFDQGFASGSVPIGILIPPEGSLAYVAHANADQISVVDFVSGTVVKTLIAGKEPDGLGWSMLTVSGQTP